MTPPAAAVVIALALALTATGGQARERPPWKASAGIELTDELREQIDKVAAIYYAKTRRTLEITSGYRSPERQAGALYAKLAAGGSLAIYKNQALVKPIRQAYREGRKKRWKKAAIIAAMTEVLEDQVASGIYLSRHMQGRAFDVRSRGLGPRQRTALMQAIREVGGMRIIRESRPPHYHVEILRIRSNDDDDAHEDDEDPVPD